MKCCPGASAEALCRFGYFRWLYLFFFNFFFLYGSNIFRKAESLYFLCTTTGNNSCQLVFNFFFKYWKRIYSHAVKEIGTTVPSFEIGPPICFFYMGVGAFSWLAKKGRVSRHSHFDIDDIIEQTDWQSDRHLIPFVYTSVLNQREEMVVFRSQTKKDLLVTLAWIMIERTVRRFSVTSKWNFS